MIALTSFVFVMFCTWYRLDAAEEEAVTQKYRQHGFKFVRIEIPTEPTSI